jgi:MOSC domain-containing protein YiiM
MGKILAVCTSEKKGTQKKDAGSALFIENHGIEGDAHAGNWHRQVSLLSHEKIEAFRAKGADVEFGAFGENLVVDGFDFAALPLGTLLSCKNVLLEMTQIGKECHSHCEIFKVMGDCIMPREGVFARVLTSGNIKIGDDLKKAVRYRAAIITASDKGSKGEREDTSGGAIKDIVSAKGYTIES